MQRCWRLARSWQSPTQRVCRDVIEDQKAGVSEPDEPFCGRRLRKANPYITQGNAKHWMDSRVESIVSLIGNQWTSLCLAVAKSTELSLKSCVKSKVWCSEDYDVTHFL